MATQEAARTRTYGEVRSNAERIADALVKERVIRGIELLRKEYGEDFVEHLDPSSLIMSSGDSCVLGQLYAGRYPTSAEIDRARDSIGAMDLDEPYSRGLAILDGDVILKPWLYGFYADYGKDGLGYGELQEGWLVALGAEELIEEDDENFALVALDDRMMNPNE